MRGFPNYGNTCYANSILQILIHTYELQDIIHSYPPRHSLSQTWLRLMERYHEPDAPTILREFLVLFMKQNREFFGMQQDQHEFLAKLLTHIHESCYIVGKFRINGEAQTELDKLELASLRSLRQDGMSISSDNLSTDPTRCYDSPLVSLFTGQFHGRTECSNCSYVSHRFDPFWSLELTVGSAQELDQILRNFSKVEQLGVDEKIECDRCKKFTQALRRMTVWRLPPVLIISLKRAQRGAKAISAVQIPYELDMAPYLSFERPDTKYKLYATANHFGRMSQHGHCTCSLLDERGQWFEIDDTIVSPISGPDPRGVSLLFYRRA